MHQLNSVASVSFNETIFAVFRMSLAILVLLLLLVPGMTGPCKRKLASRLKGCPGGSCLVNSVQCRQKPTIPIAVNIFSLFLLAAQRGQVEREQAGQCRGEAGQRGRVPAGGRSCEFSWCWSWCHGYIFYKFWLYFSPRKFGIPDATLRFVSHLSLN